MLPSLPGAGEVKGPCKWAMGGQRGAEGTTGEAAERVMKGMVEGGRAVGGIRLGQF